MADEMNDPEQDLAERSGIIAGGNFIVDQVKIIDTWPEQDTLASISSESRANGGGPYNVLKDLAAIGVEFPLEAIGLVGADDYGDWIVGDCRAANIGTEQLRQTSEAPTSYTDAMTVQGTGRRTFFHQRGANALLAAEDFEFAGCTARLFLLGYLMLLDRLDEIDAEGRSGASRVLEAARASGLVTVIDFVSTGNPQFAKIARSALPFIDHLVLNELEAAPLLGHEIGADRKSMILAVEELLASTHCSRVVMHAATGVVGGDSESGVVVVQAAVKVPEDQIAGATGAGDAFMAGYVHGVHQSESLADSLRLGVCTAAISLRDPTPSNGVGPLTECLQLGERYGFRDF
jgi:sugar/nucleoside kinase (ribokinase family)